MGKYKYFKNCPAAAEYAYDLTADCNREKVYKPVKIKITKKIRWGVAFYSTKNNCYVFVTPKGVHIPQYYYLNMDNPDCEKHGIIIPFWDVGAERR